MREGDKLYCKKVEHLSHLTLGKCYIVNFNTMAYEYDMRGNISAVMKGHYFYIIDDFSGRDYYSDIKSDAWYYKNYFSGR